MCNSNRKGIHIFISHILFNIIYIIGKINVVQKVLMFITGCLRFGSVVCVTYQFGCDDICMIINKSLPLYQTSVNTTYFAWIANYYLN